jgi:ferredoxin
LTSGSVSAPASVCWPAPDVFDQRDDDGMVVVVLENPPAHLQAASKPAGVLCPVLAIKVDQ